MSGTSGCHVCEFAVQLRALARDAAWSSADENAKAGAMEWEFEASMQAIMASAAAVDAFCAGVQARAPRRLDPTAETSVILH